MCARVYMYSSTMYVWRSEGILPPCEFLGSNRLSGSGSKCLYQLSLLTGPRLVFKTLLNIIFMQLCPKHYHLWKNVFFFYNNILLIFLCGKWARWWLKYGIHSWMWVLLLRWGAGCCPGSTSLSLLPPWCSSFMLSLDDSPLSQHQVKHNYPFKERPCWDAE